MNWSEYRDTIAATALLGTDRNPIPEPPPSENLAMISTSMREVAREEQLLSLAAACDLMDRAGLTCDKVPHPGQGAEKENLPLISSVLQGRLVAILQGRFLGVLKEFLELVRQGNRRLPPKQLPRLLTLVKKDRQLQDSLFQVMGERGAWLLAQNEEWKGLGKIPGEQEFHTGDQAERLAALGQIRRLDPVRALGLLESDWDQEKPEDKVAFLGLVTHGLSLQDEPLLEKALQDKRAEVREKAVDLLGALPGSALANRMMVRLGELIRVENNGSGLAERLITKIRDLVGSEKSSAQQASLKIDFPEKPGPEWAKDGPWLKGKIKGLGDKAAQLAKVVGATPLTFWQGLAEWDPVTWVGIIGQSDWRDAILLGLGQAAIRQKNQAWTVAVLDYWLGLPVDKDLQLFRDAAQELFVALDPERQEGLALANLGRMAGLPQPARSILLPELLARAEHPWSEPFTRKVALYLGQADGDKWTGGNARVNLGQRFALSGFPAVYQDATFLFRNREGYVRQHMDDALAVLDFRHEMHREFQQ